MKEFSEVEKDIAAVRQALDRSGKFLSLHGLSGVLAGIYALAGATYAYFLLYYPNSPVGFRFYFINQNSVLYQLIFCAVTVLFLSLTTGFWLSKRKAKALNLSFWNETTRQLIFKLSVPLLSGGIFILILVLRGYYGIVAPAFLLFYGLALFNASGNLYKELQVLAFCEILLGIFCALWPGFGLIFWAIGFGVLHVLYGVLVHRKYDV
jgi:hypothetical protein